MSERRFPVLNQQHCRRSEQKTMPRSVPWEFAERFRVRAEANHGQTLERLAERGGLAPEEMWLAAHGHGLFKVEIGLQDAIDWLLAEIAAPTPGAHACDWDGCRTVVTNDGDFCPVHACNCNPADQTGGGHHPTCPQFDPMYGAEPTQW